MKRTIPAVVACLLVGCLLVSWPTYAKRVDFHTQVVPVLMQHCNECHGGEEAKGGFSMNTLALWMDKKAAVPGKADQSLVIELIEEPDPEFAMPPKGKPRLSAEQLSILKRWIDQGMKWEEGFTFAVATYEPPLEPRRPELPAAQDGRTNPVDRIVDAYLKDNKLKPQLAVEDAGFIRRASLDLLGVLPEPADVQAFVNDTAPDKHDKLIDKLLSNDIEYARHWMTFWNDLLRNDYNGTGYITGGRSSISNWLYKSLLTNKPYDRFTRELLAPTKESEGFIKGIKWRGDVNASQTTDIQFAQNIGQVFLGINLKCASCHDSFIDRWTLEEAYGLAAVYADQALEINRCDKPTGEYAKPKWLFPELGEIDPKANRNDRLKQLADLMTSEDNGRLTRTLVNRYWHRLMGRGIVYPVDAMQTQPWSEDLLDHLAVTFSDNGYDLKAMLRLITTSQAYRARSLVFDKEPEAEDFVFAGPILKRMTAEQLVDAIRQVTETPTTNTHKRLAAAKIEKELGLVPASKATRASMLESDFLQRSLGRPNREQVVTSRPAELTTLQALDLANGEAVNNMVREGAAKLIKLHPDHTPAMMIRLVFERALSRTPTDNEAGVCRGFFDDDKLSQQGTQDLLWSVFMLPEFQHVR